MRLEGWGRWLTPRRDADAEVRAFERAMEHDLAELEYEEVTAEDRATFVEAVVEQEKREGETFHCQGQKVTNGYDTGPFR